MPERKLVTRYAIERMECKEQYVDLDIRFQEGITLRAWDIHPSQDGVVVTARTQEEDSQADFLGGRLYIVKRGRRRDRTAVLVGFDMSPRQRNYMKDDQNTSQNMDGTTWEMSSSMFWSMPYSLTDMLTSYEGGASYEENDMILCVLGPQSIQSICTSEPGDEDEFYDIHVTEPTESIELLNWEQLVEDDHVALTQLKWLSSGEMRKGKVWLAGDILRFRQLGKTEGQENPDNYGWELSKGQISMIPKSLLDIIQVED